MADSEEKMRKISRRMSPAAVVITIAVSVVLVVLGGYILSRSPLAGGLLIVFGIAADLVATAVSMGDILRAENRIAEREREIRSLENTIREHRDEIREIKTTVRNEADEVERIRHEFGENRDMKSLTHRVDRLESEVGNSRSHENLSDRVRKIERSLEKLEGR